MPAKLVFFVKVECQTSTIIYC